MSVNPLAAAIAAGLETTIAFNEERVRQIVREELAALRAEPLRQGYDSIPNAAKSRGVPEKRIRRLVEKKLVQVRAKNPDSAHPKYEILLSSLDAALAGEAVVAAPQAAPVDAVSWARARLGRKSA